ncbi:hypothetical protein DFH08DRAFT_978660 [Mycena albidolilacea]|uniref:Carboxypeptidase S n=1 Tax=Mycena albidolilacea TaxID=1033008 RepID=A0AAD7E836_9AGAR|nr:hypothetical protein DFH08DRAFT_978660 [Mycena albidolilacea]
MRGLPLEDALKPQGRLRLVYTLITLSVIGILLSPDPRSFNRTAARDFQRLPISCPIQHSALMPGISFSLRHEERVYVQRLQGAVQLRTETFDGAPQDGNNPWYDKFYEFEAYLLETFPDVFATLKLEHFATHALLLTWQGNDDSLPPIVLMAHQDTVPVPEETVERWTHPPFAGHIDTEGWVWGRGVADCKNTLIAELSAVSELIAAGFSPKRTVIVSFGFDEEGGGVHGARAAAQHLEEKYGRDSIFAIVDEGGGVVEDYFGRTWVLTAATERAKKAVDGKGEKGSVNIKVSVNVPGGHSSIPPPHTAIGILSTLVAAIEMHPSPVKPSPANPFSTFAICLAEYGIPFIDFPARRTIDDELKNALAHERTWPAAAEILAGRSAGDAARLSTTQAVDIGRDSRIQERYVKLLTPEAAKFNLSVVGFGSEPPAGVPRYLRLDTPGGAEASPVTPATGDAWRVFTGTSLHLWPEAIVAPYLSTGGTDTRSFVNLTHAIYRFRGMRDSHRENTHTVDESACGGSNFPGF